MMNVLSVADIAGKGDGSSPLKLFTSAKKRINGIYSGIETYIGDFRSVFIDVNASEEASLVDQNVIENVQLRAEKVKGIKDMLIRDHMKVAFFGRTSNGKSTVINAMLWDKILPSGLGHTTNCFLSIEGCDDKDGPYLLCSGSDEKRNVKSVSQLGHALSQESMSNDSLICIHWPKNKCALLKHEVVLVDSPGIDVTEDMDKWIDKYCLDADVFILVANAESTLMLAEKKFFHKVNERLSKPNIFILNNRWDASAAEPDLVEQVREQHLERGVSFLAKELGVVSAQQARDRVFFISAKEALNARLQKLQGMPEAGGELADGYQARLMEFNTFEHNFEECISRSATRTKFHHHAQCAQDIVQSFLADAEALLEKATEVKVKCDDYQEDLKHKISFIEKQLKIWTNYAKKTISLLAKDTESQVRQALRDEIRQLSLLVDEFNQPFHQNPMVLQVYKAELYRHVGEVLGRNLSSRCSESLKKQIIKSKTSVLERAHPLFECGSTEIDFPLHTNASTFDMSYDINCANLCCDFEEDIQFKFSLGFRCLLTRFIGTMGKSARSCDAAQRQGVATAGGNHEEGDSSDVEDILWSVATSYSKLGTPNSASFVLGIVMVPYVLWKMIGWRAFGFTVASYGALYVYERLTWTPRAQERALKRQFVEHATEKLNLITTFTSSNCSHQVQQELSAAFIQISRKVDDIKNGLEKESEKHRQKSCRLSKLQSEAKTLRNKANFFFSSIGEFVKLFLSDGFVGK